MVLSSATSPNNGTKPQTIKSRKIRKWEKYIESYNYNCPRIHRHLANRAFAVAAPSSWNSLPENVRDSESYSNCHLEFMVSYRKFRLPIDAYLLEERCCQITSRSDLKQRSLRLFLKRSPQQEQQDEWQYEISS